MTKPPYIRYLSYFRNARLLISIWKTSETTRRRLYWAYLKAWNGLSTWLFLFDIRQATEGQVGDFFKNFVAFSEKLDFTGRTNLKSLHYIYLLIINPFSYFRSTFSYCLLCLLPSFFYRQKRLKQQGDHNTEKPTKENSSNGSSEALKKPLKTAELM